MPANSNTWLRKLKHPKNHPPNSTMDESINLISLLLAVCLGLVHVFASRFYRLFRIPQRWWISLAGGVSIAYIFLDILPELGEAQVEVEHVKSALIDYLEKHVYLLSLLGLAVFYGLEKLALTSRACRRETQQENCTHRSIFWIHVFSFALYNGLLGYLLHEAEHRGVLACILLFLALALHFLANDVGLREHHSRIYDRVGRWILAGAIMAGWAVEQSFRVDAAAIAALWALITGALILNVLKEELPEEEDSHFGMFAAGALLYSWVLLAI